MPKVTRNRIHGQHLVGLAILSRSKLQLTLIALQLFWPSAISARRSREAGFQTSGATKHTRASCLCWYMKNFTVLHQRTDTWPSCLIVCSMTFFACRTIPTFRIFSNRPWKSKVFGVRWFCCIITQCPVRWVGGSGKGRASFENCEKHNHLPHYVVTMLRKTFHIAVSHISHDLQRSFTKACKATYSTSPLINV